jgi:hypothetical protein
MGDLHIIVQEEQDLPFGKRCTGIVVARIIKFVCAAQDADSRILFQFCLQGSGFVFPAVVVNNNDLIV